MTHEELVSAVREIQDRQAIRDCVYNYSRGVDRLDRELLLSVYHPDAIDDHGMFVGTAAEFADYFFDYHSRLQHTTQHIITNHVCDLDGDVAHAESYYIYVCNNKEGPPVSLLGGRYIDRFERRDGRWAIAARKCLIEWEASPDGPTVDAEIRKLFLPVGRSSRDRRDLSYERPMTIDPARLGQTRHF